MLPSLYFAKLFCLTALNLGSAQAASPTAFYRDARGNGMGGAIVATVNDQSALYLNPAAMSRLRDSIITPLDPQAELGSNTYAAAGSDVSHLENPQHALNDANKKPDRNLHERAQLSPSVVVPGFGVGLLGRYEIDAHVDCNANTFNYQSTEDFAAILGRSRRLAGGTLKVGSSVRLINRAQVDQGDIDPARTDLRLGDMQTRGLGLAADVGMIATAPVATLPSIAAVWRDIGQTSYTREGGVLSRTETAPAMTRSRVDVGLSISPIMSYDLRTSWSIEYDGVDTALSEKDQMSRVHVGGEINFHDAVFFRAGLNQRYWTAGLEFAAGIYQIQFATYGQELGTLGQSREDRRFIVQVAARF